MEEVGLTGGRVTPGVVRVADTVRRPRGSHSDFVAALLRHLDRAGFDAAPRFLGVDERGRDVLSFVPGQSPDDLRPSFSDRVLVAAARLIARYHDAVRGCDLAGREEVVCHGDLSPCNFAFADGVPVGIFDFDSAAPGSSLRELAYALFTWLNLGTDGPPLREQVRRALLMLDGYGCSPSALLVDEMIDLTAAKRDWRLAHGMDEPGGWWDVQNAWLIRNRDEFIAALTEGAAEQ